MPGARSCGPHCPAAHLQDDELTIRKGEKLHIINKFPDEWYLVQNSRGALGVVPANHLQESVSTPIEIRQPAAPPTAGTHLHETTQTRVPAQTMHDPRSGFPKHATRQVFAVRREAPCRLTGNCLPRREQARWSGDGHEEGERAACNASQCLTLSQQVSQTVTPAQGAWVQCVA